MKTSFVSILSFLLFFLFASSEAAIEGCLQGDCQNGNGTYQWASGNKYTGSFKNGRRDGQGVFIFTNGDKYIGEFKQSKRTGVGIYYFSNGETYEGEYLDDVRTGFGIYTLTNGARYEGEYLNGIKHGYGKFIFPDGKVMNGNWKNGNFIDPFTNANVNNDMMTASYALIINPFPADANIKFSDRPLTYKPGMKLSPGRYEVKISHARYKTKTENIDILDRDIVVPVTLRLADRHGPIKMLKNLFLGNETSPAGSKEKPLTRGMEMAPEGSESFDSTLIKSLQKGNVDNELNEIKQQRVNAALDESENAQNLSVIEQLKQELEMLKSSYNKPQLLSIENLSDSDSSSKYDRVALVIGNSKYPLIGELKNPGNDAKDMAEALRELGFNVIVKINADQQEMETAITEFGKLLKEDSLGLFYYAGHGVQIDGNNYLIPVQSGIKSARDIRYKAVDLNMLIDEMVYAENNKNIIIMDACRNNPLPEEDTRRRPSTGLARTDAPAGTLIAYATSPGSVAIDGEGRNGIYTKYLLEHIFSPGIPVEMVFKRVLQGVTSETDRKQIPWMSSSLEVDFYFVPEQTSGTTLVPERSHINAIVSIYGLNSDTSIHRDKKLQNH